MKIGEAIQYHDGTGNVFAAQVTRTWSDSCVNLVYYNSITGAHATATSVPRIMWVGGMSTAQPVTWGFATFDQEGIVK